MTDEEIEEIENNGERRREQIYIVTDSNNIELINYESLIIEELITTYGMDPEKSNWIDFLEELGCTIDIYPYYIDTSTEAIKVRHMDNTVGVRPIMVEGMKRHTQDQLSELRSRETFSVYELSKIEMWHGDNSKLKEVFIPHEAVDKQVFL